MSVKPPGDVTDAQSVADVADAQSAADARRRRLAILILPLALLAWAIIDAIMD